MKQPKERQPPPRDQREDARLVVLGLGSNVDGAKNIALAIEEISFAFDLLVKSTRYVGPAVGGPNDPELNPDADAALSTYSNAAVLIRTADSYKEIRKCMRDIEAKLGRDRDRPEVVAIDIDVLLIQGETIRNKKGKIKVPHRDLATRRHAAIPAAEVAPALKHTETKERIGEIAARLS